jgi:hypothetical protein
VNLNLTLIFHRDSESGGNVQQILLGFVKDIPRHVLQTYRCILFQKLAYSSQLLFLPDLVEISTRNLAVSQQLSASFRIMFTSKILKNYRLEVQPGQIHCLRQADCFLGTTLALLTGEAPPRQVKIFRAGRQGAQNLR